MPATQRKCIYRGLTLDVDRRYIGSITATTHQEKGIITLESNPSRGTVLPAPHGKGNKCDKNVKYKRTDALSLKEQYFTKPNRTSRYTQHHTYAVPSAQKECRKQSFFVNTVRDWNKLPPDIAGAPSLEIFKSRVADHLKN